MKPIRILDIGCGPGRRIKELAKKHGEFYEIVGLDKSEAMCDVAKNYLGKVNTNQKAKILCEDAMNRDNFPRASFSHILVMYFTLYYMPNLTQFFDNVVYWLRPGGYLCLHVVDREKFDPLVDVANPFPGVFSLQKYVPDRATKSKIFFNTHTYTSEFRLDKPKDRGLFVETFQASKPEEASRKQMHTFNMPSHIDIIKLAKSKGLKLRTKINMGMCGYDYQYLLCFEK